MALNPECMSIVAARCGRAYRRARDTQGEDRDEGDELVESRREGQTSRRAPAMPPFPLPGVVDHTPERLPGAGATRATGSRRSHPRKVASVRLLGEPSDLSTTAAGRSSVPRPGRDRGAEAEQQAPTMPVAPRSGLRPARAAHQCPLSPQQAICRGEEHLEPPPELDASKAPVRWSGAQFQDRARSPPAGADTRSPARDSARAQGTSER